MSKNIDERVVEMRFDNKQFEAGVSKSLSTLDKLKKSLNMKSAATGFENLEKAANKVNMTGLGKAVETVKMRFSALEVVAVTALANITNSVISTGKQMLHSLTTKPISDGFNEYELTLNAIQTTMSGTGKTAKEVEAQLKKLDEYADKTVYSSADMFNNLPKFTNAGVELEQATTAMIGIANATALAGGDARQASIAFYNLGQAIGTGYLTRMDYNSINNAGIATMEWKNQMVEAALAAGTLAEAGDGLYKAGNKTLTLQQLFIDGLQEQWATTDVMMKVFQDYGDETTEIGAKAYSAAKDLRTFSMMMDSLKATAGTGWKDTWQILFGNLDEAKALWTELGSVIEGFISAQANARNEMLQEWKDLGGRLKLIEALRNVFKGFRSIIKPIYEAFREIFPPTTAQQLYDIAENLRKFTANLKLSETASANLKSTFKGLFAVLDIINQAFSAIFTAIKPLFGGFGTLGDGILDFTGGIGDAIVAFDEFIKTSRAFQKVSEAIAKVLNKIISAFRVLKDRVKIKLQNLLGLKTFSEFLEIIHKQMSLFGKDAGKYFSGGIEKIKIFINRLKEMDSITLDDIRAIFKDFKDNVVDYFLNIGDSFDNVRKTINLFKENIKKRLKEAGKSIDTFKGKLANFVLEARSKISNNLGIGEILTVGIGAGLIFAIKKVSKAFEKLVGPFNDIANVVKNFNGILLSAKKAINAFALKTKSKALLNVAFAVATLAGSIALLTSLDQAKMWSAVKAVGVLAVGLLAVSIAMGAIDKIGGINAKSTISIIGIAASLLLIVNALKNMENLDRDKIWGNVAILGSIVGGIALISALLGKFAPELSKGSLTLIATTISLKIMASALKSLDKVEFEHLDNAIGMLIGIIASLILISVACESIKLSSSVGILALVISFKVFISTLEDLAAMNISEIKSNIKSFAIILTMFAGLIIASHFAGANAAKAGIGILAMSAALILIMVSFKMIANMDENILSKVTDKISHILVVFGVVVALSHFAGANAIKAGAMLLMMSGALAILTGVIVVLSHIKPEGLDRAITAISVLEIMFAGLIAVTALAKECKSTLILLSVTIGILVVALGALSMINPENLKAATRSLSIVIAAVAVLVASTFIAKSAIGTLLAIAAIVAILGGVIYLLATLPADSAVDIATSLSTLLISLAAVCAVLAVVGSVAPAALAGIGILAVLIVGIGAIMVGIGALVQHFPEIELFLSKGISLLEQVGHGIGSFFGNIASGFLESMSNGLPTLGENLSSFMTNMQPFFAGASEIKESVLTGIKTLSKSILILTGTNILDSLASWLTGDKDIASLGEQLKSFGESLTAYNNGVNGVNSDKTGYVIAGFRDLMDLAKDITGVDIMGIPAFVQNLTNLASTGIEGFINTFANAKPRIDAVMNALISNVIIALTSKFYEFNTVGQATMTNLIAGIRAKNQLAKDAFIQIVNSCLTVLRNKYIDFYNTGKYLAKGFANGVAANKGISEKNAKAMAKATATATEAELGVASPSKVGYRIGRFFGMGFVNSLIDYTDKSYDAGASIAKSAKEGLRNAVSKVSDFIENGIDSQPTIRPLLDLSDVTEGASRLSALLSRNQAMNISARMEHDGSNIVQNGDTKPTSGNNYNLIQNNYSPKALSRIDIYRQTKNQFSALKGLVET